MLQGMTQNIEKLGTALKKMAAPRRLVKDPRTGEKRVIIEMEDDGDTSLDAVLQKMAAPRRLVKDPRTGEKRVVIEVETEEVAN
jgi:crotonobetainyl-CoA:carnitine CoA-transferase CaiB-like acyl-CoA transferase